MLSQQGTGILLILEIVAGKGILEDSGQITFILHNLIQHIGCHATTFIPIVDGLHQPVKHGAEDICLHRLLHIRLLRESLHSSEIKFQGTIDIIIDMRS